MQLTNLNNVVAEGVTIEFQCGHVDKGYESFMAHAEFIDDVYPDRTCGQYDRGIYVVIEDDELAHPEYFISFSDGSVWQGQQQVPGARCPEVCVMVAVSDAKEAYWIEDTGYVVN
jgi:hypothetical protein